MAPLKICDADHMISSLTARKLLTGYRGAEPINIDALKKTLLKFSKLMMDLQDVVESIDLNPVMCTAKACTIVDSRIMLKKKDRFPAGIRSKTRTV
jgi:acetate---CoA ligase (ADP-forming) subunit beta